MKKKADRYYHFEGGEEDAQQDDKQLAQLALLDEQEHVVSSEATQLIDQLKALGLGARGRASNASLASSDPGYVGEHTIDDLLLRIQTQIDSIADIEKRKLDLQSAQEPSAQKEKEDEEKNKLLEELQARAEKEKDKEEEEKYLVWEPSGFGQKLFTFIHNTYETLFVLMVAMFGLLHASMVSIGFLVISCFLLFSQTMAQRRRYQWGTYFLAFLQFAILVITVWKLLKIKTMKKAPTSRKEFLFEIRFYESLGFDLDYNTDLLKVDHSPDLEYSYKPLWAESFIQEIMFTIMVIFSLIYFSKMQGIMDYLTNPESQKEIEEMLTLQNKSDEEEEEGEADELKIGSKGIMNKKEREAKAEKEAQEHVRLQQLEKKIRKNFVDCEWFYNKNQMFFGIALMFQLFEAMSYNSCSDIPSLFMILLLFAFYAVRKKHSVVYRKYSFFVVYAIQFILILKIINDTMRSIDFIREFMINNKDSKFVQINDLLFGGMEEKKDDEDDKKKDGESQVVAKWKYFLSLFVASFACQTWKATKWIEIRYKTSHIADQGFVARFREYFRLREQEDATTMKVVGMMKTNNAREKKDLKKKMDKLEKSQKGKFDSNKAVKKAKSDFSKYIPITILWLSRLFMFVLSYMYHSEVSFVHVMWIIMTFILPLNATFFFSILVMLPLLSWEFVFVYGIRIPIVNETYFFQTYGSYFDWKMRVSITEQTFMFLTLALFYMMISCLMIVVDQDKENSLLKFFKKRINDPRFSNTWKIVFFGTRYIQSIVLLTLFLNGIGNINSVKNLGFMIFFVVYTAYEEAYRRTSKLLVFFISIFILGRYYLSLNYPVVLDNGKNKILYTRLQWWSLFPKSDIYDPFDMCDGEEETGKMCYNDDMYFRFKPVMLDWFILIAMSVLNDLNKMYQHKEEVAKLTEQCKNNLRDQYSKATYYYGRVENIVKGLFIYFVLVMMVGIHALIETNLINWLFFILNAVNLALIIRGNKGIKYLKQSVFIANTIKVYALIILIIDILFISFIGEMPKPDQPNSLDQRIKRKFPKIYKNLGIIGLRSNNLLTDAADFALKYRLFAYVVYFLLSIYLVSYFKGLIQQAKGESEFTEEHYKRLFEFKMENQFQTNVKNNWKVATNVAGGSINRAESEVDFEGFEQSNSVFKKKAVYSFQDLVDFYEKTRFTLPFLVYRKINWWPFFDSIATYGHVLNNITIIYIAINFSVSAFTCLNVLCVCYFYGMATLHLNSKAAKNFEQSGLQSQCDLKFSSLITRRYKKESFQEFLRLRRKIWHFQFFALIVLICIGYPSEILYTLRERFESEYNEDKVKYADNLNKIDKVDNISFWVFFAGLYKDGRHGNRKFYSVTFLALIIGLVLERQAINWLKNRFGCTHYKLQKYIELDQRREAIRYNWEVCPPTYDIERYRRHYFHHDFDYLKEKFVQNEQFNKAPRDEYGNKPIGDFVPYKVGCRMRDTITFTVKLDAHAPETKQDDQTKKILKSENYDYESIPILRDYKVGFLRKILKEAVDRKYKISLVKGMQMFFECIMIFLLMISLVMKANLYSIVYLIFIIRFATTTSKTQLLVRLNTYMSIALAMQYFFYLLNLTAHTSPAPFPPGFTGYPAHKDDPTDKSIEFKIPLFFQHEFFRDLRICYLVGIGVDKDQVESLIIDFVNIYMVSMYILTFRNPVLRKSMQKVFWQFPSTDNMDQWKRLDKKVQKQVKWLFDPKPLCNQGEKYKQETSNYKDTKLSKKQVVLAQHQYAFGKAYDEQDYDLNYILTTYVDLKYQDIWSEDFLKEKKWEIKENSSYFRIVKQGSILIYISFHILTIFMVLLMATMRQSFLSLGYVFILLPHVKNGGEVLDQRNIHQNKAKDQLEADIEDLSDEIIKMKKSGDYDELALFELEEKLASKTAQLNKMTKKQKMNSFKQKLEEKKKQSQKQWKMISVIKGTLMIFGLIDFTAQIVGQLPLFDSSARLAHIGFRKIWFVAPDTTPQDLFSYDHFISEMANGNDQSGLVFSWKNFGMQVLNCIMIAIIMLQSEIFDSYGYIKFVTQTDGSMDLLVQLSELKAKSMTYVFNNHKIRKILSIQRRKETIMQTVDRLKQKIVRWRLFTRTTLVDQKAIQEQVKVHDEASSPSKISKKALNPGETEAGEPEEKEKKKVKFEEEEFEDFQIAKRAKIAPEETERVHEMLAMEFVKTKKSKMRKCVRFYNWLNLKFTEQIMFKNRKQELEELKQRHAEGDVLIPTELERIMQVEAKELIKQHYDHLEGSQELAVLIQRMKGKSSQSLLQLTNFEKKIKLNQMKKTWEFTRTFPMLIRYVETFFYILISQTQALIYFGMIFSMWQNAGVISLPYPIAVFGYAMLEETRPRKEFWDLVRVYTTIVLLFKLILNLAIFEDMMDTESFKFWTALLKIGIFDYDDIVHITLYMMPEIMIIGFIMLNEIKLKLLGLYYNIEQDIETVMEGIQRNIEKGDEERVKMKRIEAANMCMSRFFEYRDKQIEREEEYFKILKDDIKTEIRENNYNRADLEAHYGSQDLNECVDNEFEKKMAQNDPKQQQEALVEDISNKIWKTTKHFDLDSTQKNSPFDVLVKENVLSKTLENDNLIYMEGMRRTTQPDFMSRDEFQAEFEKPENWETLSAGDFDEAFDQRFDEIDERQKPKLGMFEKSAYFDKVFPGLKIQKPGYDLYGSTTVVLALIAVYVFVFFKNFNVDPSVFKFIQGQSSIFKGDMAVTLLVLIIIIIIERYANRTDTKAVDEERKRNKGNSVNTNSGFFNQEEIFSRTTTQRSMTVKLKTMKTSDLDMQGNAAQEFLKQMYGAEEGGDSFDEARTKITTQQKTKYVIHWLILICGHIYIFWFIPINGNYALYGQPQCNQEKKDFYGCMNFHENPYLRILYVFILFYLILSSLQLAYGFPIMKKPSSVLQYYTDLAKLGSDIYISIPFAVELRCLLDFTMSKTSLDIFQFYQLYNYHYEIYAAKIGNRYYYERPLGAKTDRVEKCIFGVFISSVLMFFLVGPFILFSEYGGFVASNPVLSGDISIGFQLTKTIFTDIHGEIIPNVSADEAKDLNEKYLKGELDGKAIHSTIPYILYQTKNPFLRQYDDDMWEHSNYSSWTESRYFQPEQVQECMLSSFSDTKWSISDQNLGQLRQDLMKAVNTPEPNTVANLSLGFKYQFVRAQPSTAMMAETITMRPLNYSKFDDCVTGKQIEKFANFKCASEKEEYPIVFRQALNPNMVLGQTNQVKLIDREGEIASNLMHDIRLVYRCDNTWELYSKPEPTSYNATERKHNIVDPETCEYIDNSHGHKTVDEILKEEEERSEKEWEDNGWERFKLTLFSMLVSSSFLASYNPSTFYTSVVLIISTFLRPVFIFGSWKGWIYEATETDAIIKLIEACYIARHEEDLVAEEETYHMLMEIFRQPELFRALTGSALKGSIDPALDKLNEAEKKKLEHLSKLEQKGFEVQPLKEKLLKNSKANNDY